LQVHLEKVKIKNYGVEALGYVIHTKQRENSRISKVQIEGTIRIHEEKEREGIGGYSSGPL